MSIGEMNAEDLEGLVGRELDGRYLLDKFIDRGGFGAVYRGIDKKFNQPVAVKVGFSYREFMKEAKLAAEVRHDHIVQVSDYGNDNGLAYLVMEFLQGEDLEKLFQKQGYRLTPEQMRKFVSEVGDALAHAHADHLIHRDLKPRNIILKQHPSKTGATGTTATAGKFVLLDFGIAAKLDVEGTQRNRTQDGAGTLEYMAPELLQVKPTATPQSDIYAFGILTYQMLTGRVPYPQTDMSHIALAEIVHAISHAPPPRFAEVAPDRNYPPAVEELVLQCLEKDPERRPQTMAEVRDRFLAAFPPTTRRRADFSQTIHPDDFAETADHNRSETDHWRQGQTQQPPTSRWPWLFVTVGLLVALTFAIGQQFLGGPTYSPVSKLTVAHGSEVINLPDDASPLPLEAGERITLTFAIDDLPRGTVAEFESLDLPAGVQVEATNGAVPGTTKSYTLSIPDLNTPPGLLPSITLRAAVPGHSTPFEKTLQLDIRRPRPWLPEALQTSGFRESSDSWLCRVGTSVLASILERRIAGQTVRFRLVPATEIGDRRVKTFYVMEQLVTNALFNEFAKAEPAFEWVPRNQSERGWEAADDFPVTDIYVLEAQRFALWLAGPSGSLPTTTEWELSAGYYDFLRVLKSRFGRPPSEIPPEELSKYSPVKLIIPDLNAEVWMGLGPALNDFHEPQGNALKGRSPYGCQYARLRSGVRPTEMTATVKNWDDTETDLRELCRPEFPEKGDKSLPLIAARLRGSGEPTDAQREMLWVMPEGKGLRVRTVKDLDDPGIVYLQKGGLGQPTDSYIGFRAVLLTDIERK